MKLKNILLKLRLVFVLSKETTRIASALNLGITCGLAFPVTSAVFIFVNRRLLVSTSLSYVFLPLVGRIIFLMQYLLFLNQTAKFLLLCKR